MEKRLFLTGLSGCGKTTMIRNALGDKLSSAGGFVTERIILPNGTLAGFELFPTAAAAGVEGFEGYRFLDYSVNPVRKDNEVFRIKAVELLDQAQYYPFTVLDEIGGYEMLIPQFRSALADFFNTGVPCIGVLKGAANASELKRSFGLGDKFTMQLEQLRGVLDSDPNTLLLEISGRDDKKALEAVRQWVSEYAT